MPVLFHQNMRTYGGAAGPRNTAYFGGGAGGAGALAAVAAGVGGAGPVAVAGFTEIVNNLASVAGLTACCASLGIHFAGSVACGITALARGPEYIGLGVNAAWPLLTVGRVLFGRGAGGGMQLFHQRAATAGALDALGFPFGMSADYRGLVYLVATHPGVGNVAVGFLHNLFTLQAQRILVAGQLGNLMNAMGAAAGGLGAVAGIVARYVGGDFNVAPLDPRGGFPAHSAVPAAYPHGGVPGGTTWSGNTYDYWYSSIAGAAPAGLVAPVPAAYADTLDKPPRAPGLMSDHAAVTLQIS